MKTAERFKKNIRLPAGSIQKRILIITISCLFCMCVIISSVSFYIFQNYLQNSLIHSTEASLQLLSDSINSGMDDISQIVRFCQTNTNIATYIQRNPNPGSILSVSTYDRMYEEYGNNPSKDHINRLAVITNEHFLQIVSATYSSTADLTSEVPKLPYFDRLLEADTYDFSTGFVKDPFSRNGKSVLPVIRPITYKYSSVRGGVLFLEISSDLFTSALKRYTTAEDSYMYLSIGGHSYVYRDDSLVEMDEPYQITRDLSSSTLTETISVKEIQDGEGSRLVLISPLNMPDCYICQSISHSELRDQQLLLWPILGGTLVSIVGIGILLMITLNRMINVPVSKIRAKMLRVADGDFERDPSIEWNHELGEIGRGINDLSENVYLLMNRRLEDEKQKKDLEYKMLQSQINPHFIYNTLNSIKWMATIQGSAGISEMTTALAKLLKSISKGTRLMVPIEEELSLLQDYFTIQSYRYGGTITMEIQVDEDSLLQCQIIKFTLQPLVENAIFHGVEPKGAGHILIHVSSEKLTEESEPSIRIDVTDDGIGIPAEKAAQILLSNEDNSTEFFREIGVSNVHKRLQYEFGAAYGITIDSVEGEYTTMSIHIPCRI
ncbi:MAG: sensor histidine kinase [Lachnospiraceae bacterium]|nr:sensor histidine kinase [Lachnospiraceae bacterium]MCM1215637.1 sensor histidine kinase [Lachnospiraceae bacterium]MCM1238493.1 sensor histidine kinase [Lachnospiraceae bacterium]